MRESHAQKLKSKGLGPDAIAISGAGPILPRLRQCFDALEVDFNKGSAAKLIRRDLIRCKGVGELPDGVAKKAETLLRTLRVAGGCPT